MLTRSPYPAPDQSGLLVLRLRQLHNLGCVIVSIEISIGELMPRRCPCSPTPPAQAPPSVRQTPPSARSLKRPRSGCGRPARDGEPVLSARL
ncbi:MAG: hypothetical protein MZV63_07185 [Marinilabiliales bacterium]|nr:hypothetical protein [Marinilabiliales bacterium]